METYIDFIKQYNKEKTNSSSEDSSFDNFLKGGGNNIKGGFPPVYPVDTINSDSFREYSPNLKIEDVLQKNPKTPFLNINSNEGGFLNLFKSKNENINNKDNELTSISIPKSLEIITINSENKSNHDNLSIGDTSINLPSELEIVSIDKNDENNLDTVVDLQDNVKMVSIEDVQHGGNDLDTSVDLPDNIEVVSIEDNNLEVSNIHENQLDGNDLENLSDNVYKNQFDDLDTSVDLPDNIEIEDIIESDQENLKKISNNSYQSGGDDLDTSVDLPDMLEVVSIEEQKGGYDSNKEIDAETSVDLPDVLEVVSFEPLNQDGGFSSESSNDFFDSSIYLPNNIDVITLNRDGILESVDTDSSLLDILDIKQKNNESIGNLFMRNFK